MTHQLMASPRTANVSAFPRFPHTIGGHDTTKPCDRVLQQALENRRVEHRGKHANDI
jgi:hypothetical protein